MPGRIVPLVNNQVYHVLNRGIASQPVFLNKRDYKRALETFFYYQNQKPPLSYSHLLRQPVKIKGEILVKLGKERKFLVEVFALCLMPNHFHLLLRQSKKGGISTFMSNFTNSYTRYFNTKNKRVGPLFQGKFKAVRIGTDEQLLHVSRYIHLNPLTSFVVKNLMSLKNYPYSSLSEYLGLSRTNYFQKEEVLGQFKTKSYYKKFVFDQVKYQRSLEEIKHLLLK